MTTTTYTKAQSLVARIAFDAMASDTLLADAIRKAGPADKRTRDQFILGALAQSLMTKKARADYLASHSDEARDALLLQAGEAMAKAGHKPQVKTLKDKSAADVTKYNAKNAAAIKAGEMRTQEEETAYAAARQSWSRFTKRHELVTTDTKQGNTNAKAKASRKPRAAEPSTKPQEVAKKAATPSAVNAIEAAAWLMEQATTMALFAKKNAKSLTVEQRNLIVEFGFRANELREKLATADKSAK